jgi:hypothetical protein
MSSIHLTPILIVGFNRPKTMGRLLAQVETLSSRNIVISIDGPRNNDDLIQVQNTRAAVQNWLDNTHHSARTIENDNNLGIYNHCVTALAQFFSEFNTGIILEDDIEFKSEFIYFVDNHNLILNSGEFWSICGHNPISDLANFNDQSSILLRKTYVHTNWGWAVGKKSVETFFKVIEEKNLTEFDSIIQLTAKKITRDPFVRLGVRNVWGRKIRRAISGDKASGWDNLWLLAGWISGLPSLSFSHSLSRENPNQDEGQTHPHASSPSTWPVFGRTIDINNSFQDYSLGSDVQFLRVWGISRAYCWIYFIRLLRGIPRA